MLQSLHVRNLAVAAEVAVELGPGLNVLTGETGAGKSILVDSLALLAGARATGDLIRSEAEQLTVAGTFTSLPPAAQAELEAAGFGVGDGQLVVRRVVSREGRNRVFVNDEPVTLRFLGALSRHLIRIHTQREELGLVSPETQRRWLDKSAGVEGRKLVDTVAAAYRQYSELNARFERLTGNDRLRLERLDLLRFQCREIDGAGLGLGEEEELGAERERLRHSDAIGRAIGGSLVRLVDDEGSALDRFSQSERELEDISGWEPEAAQWSARLVEARVKLEDLASEMRSRLGSVDADPARLNAVEERLTLIERLLRKYGDSTREVLELRQRMSVETEELEASDEERAELEAEVAKSLERYETAALELSQARRRWGVELAERIHAELRDLAMGRASFETLVAHRRRQGSPLQIDGKAVDFSVSGVDEIVFQLAANPGERQGALARVASGGELSRVYLALQLAVQAGGASSTPAMVFDEVDAGIGGAEAAALGKKLERLARQGQILAVTHLPQVASFADRHFRIRKRVVGGRTSMRIQALDAQTRIDEIARMLGGKKVTDLSRSHAEELITVAGKA